MVSTHDHVALAVAEVVRPRRRAPVRLLSLAALAVLPAAAWLVLRPSSPQGAAAVVDLIVLPAVLFAWVLLLAGRPTLRPTHLALFFSFGATCGTLSSFVVERAAGVVGGRPALHAVGPLVEALATGAPLALFPLVGARKGRGVADTTLAGLASGLGFLVVQASLATATLHAGPEYASPLLAGFHRVPASAGSPPVYFAGAALAAALVGLAVGLAARFEGRAWRLAPAAVALSLVVFDHGLFDWRLRHLVAARVAGTSGLVDIVQQVTLQGRLTLLLLAAGLVAARLIDRRTAAVLDLRERDDPTGGDETEPAPAGTETPEAVAAETAENGLVAGAAPGAWFWLAPGLAVAAGAGVTLAARSRHLGILDNRPLALAVALAGLGYSLWHLPAGRSPDDGADLRLLVGGAAVACSALGVACAFAPSPHAVAPAHGSLFLETALGWGAHVGNLGLLLGIGGFAAPAGGHVKRRFGDRWNAGVLRRLGWTGWSTASRAKGVSGGRYERVSKGRTEGGRHRSPMKVGNGQFLWFKLAGGPLGTLLGKRGAKYRATEDRPRSGSELAVALAIEPIYRSPSRVEFAGATVQEAIKAAMRAVGADLAHNSIQLIDHGSPAKAGKPGSGRPARVRVAEARDDADDVLVPPGRDSIVPSTAFTVSVLIAGEEATKPAPSVSVMVRAAQARRAGARALSCYQTDASPERARYRSNPYSPDGGEDTTMARPDDGAVAAAGGTRVANGADIVVEFRGEQAVITVYDDWRQQVIGVNRRLFDLTEEHHRAFVTELEEELAAAEAAGEVGDDIRRCVRRLEARLAALAAGRRLLTADTSGEAGDDAARAFASTAALHAAMSVEDGNDMVQAASDALQEQRIASDQASPTSVYRAFLQRTEPGKLWASGAYSVGDVVQLLGWDRFAESP